VAEDKGREEEDKLEAELKAALKARRDAEPIVKAGKRIRPPSKNGKRNG
jgi:hypothetical protein